MNADTRVAEFLPNPLARAASDALAARIEAHFELHGYGLWAVEVPGELAFAGFIGLLHRSREELDVPFAPCVEIGWRLATRTWGRGLATEGAREVLRYGFEELGLPEIVSFTVPANVRSRRVMEKIGLVHDPSGDFEHPGLPSHPLAHHVLYRARRDPWLARAMA